MISNDEQITSPFTEVLAGGIVELTVGESSTRLMVHRHILQKLPYFNALLSDNTTIEIILPDVSTFAASTVIQFLYGAVANPFTSVPNSLAAKIAVAQTFIVAERLGMADLADMAASRISSMQLEHGDQLEFWKFVYTHTAKGSRLRIPSSPGLSARWFVTGLEEIGRTEELDASLHDRFRTCLGPYFYDRAADLQLVRSKICLAENDARFK